MQQSIKYLIFLSILWCNAAFPAGESVSTSAKAPDPACERWIPAQGKPRGVLLLTHGLNNAPAKLDGLGAALSAAGFEVYRPGFTGHCGSDPKAIQEVQADSWDRDASHFYSRIRERAGQLKVPLYHVAYSFSGLVYQSHVKDYPFARRVFLAPALEVKFWYPLGVFLLNILPNFAFPTQIPEGYYAHKMSGFKAVIAMNHFFEKWGEQRKDQDGIPTLIWGDPSDELVNVPRLRDLAAGRKNWEFRETSVAGCKLSRCYHHLILDSASVGAEEWNRIQTGTIEFLSKP